MSKRLSVQLEGGEEQDLDALDQTQSDYLSAASDLEDTDGEPLTDGEAYTDNEDLEEAYADQESAKVPKALARSSEPASVFYRPTMDPEPQVDREIPPLLLVPEPKSPRRDNYSPPQSTAEEEDPSHRSFTDSDFSALDAVEPTPSEGPPDFVAPSPARGHTLNAPPRAAVPHESPQHASLSAIEEKLQQVKNI